MDRRMDRPSLTSGPQIPENCPISSTGCVRGGGVIWGKNCPFGAAEVPEGAFWWPPRCFPSPRRASPHTQEPLGPLGGILGGEIQDFPTSRAKYGGGGRMNPRTPMPGDAWRRCGRSPRPRCKSPAFLWAIRSVRSISGLFINILVYK